MIEMMRTRIDELVSLILRDQLVIRELENELTILQKTDSSIFTLIANMGYGRKSLFHLMLDNNKYNYAEIFLKFGFSSSTNFIDILSKVYIPSSHNDNDLNIIKNMLSFVIKNNIQKKYIDIFFKNICFNISSSIFVFCCEEFNKSIICFEDQLMIFAGFYTHLHMIRHQVLHHHLIKLLEHLVKNKINITENTIRILFKHSLGVKCFTTRYDMEIIPINKICLFLVENYVINPYIGESTIIDKFANIIDVINNDNYLSPCNNHDVNNNTLTLTDFILKLKNIIISKHHVNEYMKMIIPFPILEELGPHIDYSLITYKSNKN